MNTRFFTMTAFALSLGLSPAVFSAETPAPPPDGETAPPPPEQPGGRMRGEGRRGGMMMGMNEEEQARFAEFNSKVESALAKYRESQKEEDLAALKQAVSDRFVALQQFQITRAEQMIARAREQLEKKDAEIDRQVKRMLSPRNREQGPRPDRPGRRGPGAMNFDADAFAPFGKPEEKPEAGPNDKRGPGRDGMPRVLNDSESAKVRAEEQKLQKVKPDSAEAAAAVKEIAAVCDSARKRIQAELDAAKEDKERARIERSLKMLDRMIERTKDPVKYAKSVRERMERGSDGKDKKDGKDGKDSKGNKNKK